MKYAIGNKSSRDFLEHQLLALEQAIFAMDSGDDDAEFEDKETETGSRSSTSRRGGSSFMNTEEGASRPLPVCKINPLTWDEFASGEDKPNWSQQYALDLQCEDQLEHITEKPHTLTNTHGPEAAMAPDHHGRAPMSRKPLPARVRINSPASATVLDLLDDRIYLRYSSGSVVLKRPFYTLVRLESMMRQLLCKLREKEMEVPTGAARPEPEPQFRSEFRIRVMNRGSDLQRMTLKECKALVDGTQCVLDFIDEYLVPLKNEVAERPQTIRFAELWFLFPVGTFVYVKNKKIPQKVWRVTDAVGERPIRVVNNDKQNGKQSKNSQDPFYLICFCLDWDGSRFIRVFREFEIERFGDLHAPQSVSSFPIIPLDYAVRDGLVETESLKRRGEKFIQCTRQCHQYYSGRSLDTTPTGNVLWRGGDGASIRVSAERIDSQVMVDFERAFEALPDWRPVSQELESPRAEQVRHPARAVKISPAPLGMAAPSDFWHEDVTEYEKTRGEFMGEELAKWDRWDRHGVLPSEDDLLLLPDRVFAFVFRSRSWCCLQLGTDQTGQERLRPVTRRDDAWSDLQLPEGHKDIVQALIRSHFVKEDSDVMEFDLIRDKGKGVILLLHGVPGVGKTSTAECVAETECKPLLPITCGDLGITARDVEAKLQYSFQLAQAWDCVLLLDEADIFLAERTGEGISRNALVSVFLRVLEYYEGILFLTTNRVGAIDEAFKSRIHMALYYPPLDKLKTKKIWRSQIRRAKERHSKFKCDKDALIDYADQLWDQQSSGKGLGPVWNGRQIRNAFKSAVALANYHTVDGEINLEIHNFEKVARVSNEFNNYFWRVHGKRSDGKIAAENRIRDDSYRVDDMSHSHQQYSAPVANPQTSHGMSRFASAQTGFPTFGSQPVQQEQQHQPIYPSTSGLGGQQFSGIPTQGYVPNPQSQHFVQQPGQNQQGQAYPPSQQQMMPIQQTQIPVQQPPQSPQHAQPFQTVPQSQYVAQHQQLSPQLLHQQMQFSQMAPESQQQPPHQQQARQ